MSKKDFRAYKDYLLSVFNVKEGTNMSDLSVLWYYALLTMATNLGAAPSHSFPGVDDWQASCAVLRIWNTRVHTDTALADKFLLARAAIAATNSAFSEEPGIRIGVQMLQLLGLGMPCLLPKNPFFVELGELRFSQWRIEPMLDGHQGFISTVEELRSGIIGLDSIPLMEVCKFRGKKGKEYFFVVEGNRRLAAYLLSFPRSHRILVRATNLFPTQIASKMEPLGALSDLGKLVLVYPKNESLEYELCIHQRSMSAYSPLVAIDKHTLHEMQEHVPDVIQRVERFFSHSSIQKRKAEANVLLRKYRFKV